MSKDLHKKLTDRESIQAAVKYINDSINGRGFNFMDDTTGTMVSLASPIIKENPHSILILASFDFSYYHNLELIFYEVGYTNLGYEYSWWDHWTKDQIELGDEVPIANGTPNEFEFRFNRGTHSDIQYIIRAKAFSYHFEKFAYRG